MVIDRHGREITGETLARPPEGPPFPAERYRNPGGEPFHEPPSIS